MSIVKHTPGLWVYVNDSPYHRVHTPNGLLYVASSEGANYKEEQEESNAKLIAAAPELLDAVKQFVWNWENDIWTDADIESAKEVIKKATA